MTFKKSIKDVFGFVWVFLFVLLFFSEIQPQLTANPVGLCHLTVRLKQRVNIFSFFPG